MNLISLTVLLLANVSYAEEILPISEARERMKFVELLPKERQLIADRAKLVIDGLYVNKFHKNDYYGISPTPKGHLDPITEVDKIAKQAHTMSTYELHDSLSTLFISQRDLHFNYLLPLRFYDHFTEMPMRFTRVKDKDDFFEIRVTAAWNGFSLYPERPNPKVGDILIGYQGKSIEEAMRELIPQGQGSNPYAGFNQALRYMTFRWNGVHLLPKEDTVSFKFRSAETGEEYEVAYEWLVYSGSKIGGLSTPESEVLSNSPAISYNHQQALYNQSLERHTKPVAHSMVSNIQRYGETFYYTHIPYQGANYGYLYINSFLPSTGWWSEYQAIRDLLQEQNALTDGLIINVSNNPGGTIYYAETLPGLFTKKTSRVHDFRLLNSELNQYLFLHEDVQQMFPFFKEALDNVAGSDAKYSSNAPITTPELANVHGQVYTKPVAVMANSSTYSAGDLFTCAMQDNDAAVIYGADPKTGAGGANIISYNFFYGSPTGIHTPLPLGIDMDFSFRQAVRFGHHSGQIIEDYGCTADVDISPTPEDLVNGNQTMLTKVLEGLKNQAVSKSNFEFADDKVGTYYMTLNPQDAKINLLLKNTEKVRISVASDWWSRMETEETYHANAYGNNAKLFTLPITASSLDTNSFVIKVEGLDGGNEPLWNFKRGVEITE
ncbi:S41 family peptidase [Vibrio variabilis]|uniref:S41 family peptidase n=1 Tax=Vibrio variabilis TaxID=990271 RepID=UPI0013A6D6C3|nr:S41 family peptidase [Vibrio variabilis]